jgi:hypothetical protein
MIHEVSVFLFPTHYKWIYISNVQCWHVAPGAMFPSPSDIIRSLKDLWTMTPRHLGFWSVLETCRLSRLCFQNQAEKLSQLWNQGVDYFGASCLCGRNSSLVNNNELFELRSLREFLSTCAQVLGYCITLAWDSLLYSINLLFISHLNNLDFINHGRECARLNKAANFRFQVTPSLASSQRKWLTVRRIFAKSIKYHLRDL